MKNDLIKNEWYMAQFKLTEFIERGGNVDKKENIIDKNRIFPDKKVYLNFWK